MPGAKRETMAAVATDLPLPLGHAGESSAADFAAEAAPATWTRDSFQRQVQPLLPRLYRMCLTLCHDGTQAEDLLQSSLVKAYVGRQAFVGRGSLAGWLFGIIRHEHVDFVRTTARRRSLMDRALSQCLLAVEDMVAVAPVDPETWIGLSEEGSILLECLRAIAEPYRLVVLLCDVEEMSHDEIARTLGIAVGTVKSRHARGRARLRAAYERRVSGKSSRGGT